MKNDIRFVLDDKMAEKLQVLGELLRKDSDTMLNEALQQYIDTQEKILSEKDPMTDLDFNEFWDDVDLS